MSTEQSIDPHLIEQTKQQIRSLVAEIAQLAKEDISPEEFYGEFLTRVVSALAAVGGAVWTTNHEGQLALQYQINLQETRLRESEEAQAQHSRLLYKVLSDGEAVLLPPHCGGEATDEAGNPTEFLLLFGLLKTDLETVGMVEIFQRTDSGAATQKGYLRFLMQMCELAGDYLEEPPAAALLRSANAVDPVGGFHPRGPRLARSARNGLHDRQRRPAADRVRPRERGHPQGQQVHDRGHQRPGRVRQALEHRAAVGQAGHGGGGHAATRSGTPATPATWPPQVEDAVQEYVDEAHSKTVAVLPLQRPEPPEEDDPKKRPEPQPPHRRADRRADRGQPRAGEHVAAGGSGLPAQFHGAGQLAGASEPVSDAGVAGVRQDPLGRPGPDAAENADHQRRRCSR